MNHESSWGILFGEKEKENSQLRAHFRHFLYTRWEISSLVLSCVSLSSCVDKLKIKIFILMTTAAKLQRGAGRCVCSEIENVWLGKFMLMCFDVVVRDCTIWLWIFFSLVTTRFFFRNEREKWRRNFLESSFNSNSNKLFMCVKFSLSKLLFSSCTNSNASLSRSSFYCFSAS